jgi:peptidoglycan-associated lipoprotein
MRKLLSVLIFSTALSACAGSGSYESEVFGPVVPPEKPVYVQDHGDLVEINLDTDFLAASGTNTVFFDTNQSTLTPQARDVLTKQLAWFMTHRDVEFKIEGHCDERASLAYNLALAKRRAEAVKDFFVQNGIRESRISTETFGESSPVYDKNGDIQINRRAVTVLLPN